MSFSNLKKEWSVSDLLIDHGDAILHHPSNYPPIHLSTNSSTYSFIQTGTYNTGAVLSDGDKKS